MKQKRRTIIFCAAAALAAVVPALASTFNITSSTSGNAQTGYTTTFSITRSGEGVDAAETVNFRTVGLSAYAGQHYTATNGVIAFAAGETNKTVAVKERRTAQLDSPYRFQVGSTRSYRFELLDVGGFGVTNATRSLTIGTSVPSSGMFDTKSVTIQSSEYTADDGGYDKNGYKAAASSGYFDNTAPRAWFQQIGAELRMTLSMDAKENDDAYEYLQLLFDNVSSCDNRSGASNGDPGSPNLSKYMAGFEMNTGSKDSTYRNYTFPVTSVASGGSATNPWGYSSDGKYPLSKQNFKSGSRAADGRIVVPLDFTNIVLRLNASGSSGSDEWAAKNVKAHIQALDSTKPVPVGTAAISVGPGPYCNGNFFYISVPFRETVYSSGIKTIYTTWGDADYHSGDGSNVITFRGTINADVGKVLEITGASCNFRDFANNYYQDNASGLNKTFTGTTVAASYAYPISYDLGGGTLPENAPTSYTYDAEATLRQPTRAGYDFVGWTGSNGSTPQKNVHISIWSHGPRSYTANWSIVTYTNTYDLADGALPEGESNPETYTVTNATFTLVNPVRTGYTFTGWTGTGLDEPTNEVTIASGSTGDRSYTANWTTNAYTVCFHLNNGSSEPRYQEFSYDVPQSLDPAIARTGYDFAGWCTNEDVTVIFANCAVVSNLTAEADGVVDLYAQWVGHSYIVRFDGNAADAVGNTDEMGMTYDVPDNLTSNGFTRTGYDFAGWSTSANGDVVYADGVSVSNLTAENNGSVTLYAQWMAHTYSVRFDANGGEGEMSDQLFTYDVATNLEANAFSRIGYDFAGWSTSENGAVVYADGASVSNLTAENHGSVTLYAQWTAHTYTVRFDANGGEGEMSDQVFTYDVVTNLDANVFTRKGYDFVGWSTSANGVVVYADGASVSNLTAEKCGSVTLYAQWTLHTYSVHFDANGGEGEMSDQVFTYDVVTNLPANVFSRTGYDFAGWSTSANGTVVYADGASVSNLTAEAGGIVDLYAQWTAHTYTVRFDRNAADATGEMADMQFTYDAPQALTSNAFARAGYAFAGWLGADSTTYPDGATVLNLTNAQDAVATLVAQWRVNIPYIDADGNERICADYTVLTSAARDVVYGAGGATAWYVVTNAVNISGRLRFCDDTAHLILCDGATLAVTNAFYAIEACNLAIYGQADSTGAVVGNGIDGIFCGGSVTINGGTVTAAGGDGSGCGIWASSLTINGGTVTAEGVKRGVYAGFVMINGGTVTAEGNSYGIVVQNDITLGWTKPNDSITASSYSSLNGGAVYVKSRKYLTDGVEVYSGKLDDSQVAAIAGATLRPSEPPPLAYVDADGVERQCLDYVVIASGSDAATLGYAGEETWYAVTNNVSISGGLKFLDKYAHIIVADGATLTVVNQDGDAVYAQKNLVVYGQSAGTGKLVAIGGDNGVYVEEGLVINHVIVNATGNDEYGIYSWGWAIGDGEVVINGATVTAEGGECGFFTYDGLIINGGSLTASGKIGIHTDYTLTLNDGQIEAIGDTHGIQSDEWLVANGGSVNAVGEGDSGIYAYNGIIVNDGTIVAEGGKNGLYVEFALFVNGGRVNATGGNCGVYAENGDITVVGGNATFTATLENRHGICAEEGDIILGWTNPTDSITLNGCYSEEGGVYVKKGRVLTDGADLYEGKIDLDDVASKTLRPYFSWESLQKMLDAGGTAVLPFGVTSADGDATLVVTNTVTLDLAGYAIDADGLFGVIEVREGGNLTLTNSVPESGAITGGQAYYGGGVYVYYGGAFTMTGGEISGNSADYYGGGVYVNDGGAFTMTGGEISGNSADYYGGGVYVDWTGTFTMTGGTISGNTARWYGGGGVYVNDGGAFTMCSGEISGNTAYYDGGGVFVNDGTFKMAGGTISGNVANYASGMYMCGDFTVSGSPVVSGNTNSVGAANNVYLPSEKTIEVSNLTEGASIGMTTDGNPADGPVFFATGAAAGDAKYFFSDNPAYLVGEQDGELCLDVPLTPWVVLQRQLNKGGTVTLTNDVTAADGDAHLTVRSTVTLDLNGHTITGNVKQEEDCGGVIYVGDSGNLTLTNSVPETGAITGGYADYGGGVYVNDGGAFTMTGGEISGNSADYYGGGVYVGWTGTFTMTGGAISGNEADYGGGGVFVCEDGRFIVSDSPVVFGNTNDDGAASNVYLSDVVMVVSNLHEGAFFGVTTYPKPTPSRPVAITSGAAEGDIQYFTSDIPERFVEADANGELCVKVPMTPWAELQALLDQGGVVTLTNSVVATPNDTTLVVRNTVLLDLAGHTIDAARRFCAMRITDGGNLTLTNSVEGVGAITGGDTGVSVRDGGKFTMTGGAISGNHNGGESTCGGVDVSGGTFTMTGGTISGNSAAESAGGVEVSDGGVFTMTGGTITGNLTDRTGCGVYISSGLMAVSGRPVISGNTNWFGVADNVYLSDDAFIAVVGDLEDGAYIGVTTENKPMPGSPVTITSGAATGDDRYFHSDLGTVSVGMVDGEVCLERSSFTAWEILQSKLDEGGVVALADDVVATDCDESLVVTNTVTLDLAGHTIDAAGRIGIIEILDGGNLTLTNSVEGAGSITGVFIYENYVVYVGDGGMFTMAGGAISGNKAEYCGGVFVDDGGVFVMTGGAITGNSANNGGGVYVDIDATFTMTGGAISGNEAESGGGVYVEERATFTMIGGTISGNAAPYGGVYVDGDFTVSGSPVVAGNTNFVGAANDVWLCEDKTIAVSNLAEGASIGVATQEQPTLERSVTITSGAADGDIQYFFSDDSVNCAVVVAEGELNLVKTHSTQWEALQARLDEGGAVTLTDDVAATLVDTYLVVTNTVLLDLNGHSLVGNGVYMILVIGEGGDLTLTNSVEGVGAITGGYYDNAAGGVCVDEGGAFTMSGGAITGNGGACGGVCVFDGGTFTMSGGVISGNTAKLAGGGVYVDDDGTFTMTGGAISGNGSINDGGGVYVGDGGTFTMAGGAITSNTAIYGSGGVYVEGLMSATGNPVVSGNVNDFFDVEENVWLEYGKTVVVSNLADGASIGVTTEFAPVSGRSVHHDHFRRDGW